MIGKVKIAVAAFLVLGLGVLIFLRLNSARAGDAWIKCRDVRSGMGLEEALAVMGRTYQERQQKDDRGRRQLVFPAPLFADTVPVLYVNPETETVEDVACQ